MNRGWFLALTFAGSFPWSVGLAAGGYKLGENYDRLREWMRPADIPIAIVLVALVGWFLYRHVRRAFATSPGQPGP
jgi:membrane protein DedA with SNARE-associated domain